MRLLAAFAGAVMICFGVSTSFAEKRVALVVGNDRYSNLPADEQLRKAANDARTVGDALSSIGFEVLRGENLGRQAMVDKLDELARKLAAGDTAFFFFAGHGVTIGGGNYILPADVPNVETGQEVRLTRAALSESDIVSDLQGRGVRVAVVVLDACRNNPFKRLGVRGVGGERGLSRIEPVRGVFTLYSAGIGQTALDRLGDADIHPNSVFTRVFAPAVTRAGLSLGDLAVEVRDEVARLALSVSHEQLPAYYDQTTGGRVYLVGVPAEATPGDPTRLPAPGPNAAERAWAEAKDTKNQAVLEEFISRFGDSFYAALARARLEELRKGGMVALPPPQPPPPKFTIRRTTAFGGKSGEPFDDADSNLELQPVSAIYVTLNLNPADQKQRIVGSLKVQWNGIDGPVYGGKGPFPQAASPTQLGRGEAITKIEIYSRSYNFPANPPPVWISGLRIFTNRSTYTYGDVASVAHKECVLEQNERLLGFFGRAGSYLDQIGCIIGRSE